MQFQVPIIRNIINKHPEHHHGGKYIPTMVEGYSTNEGAKGKTSKRAKKNLVKH